MKTHNKPITTCLLLLAGLSNAQAGQLSDEDQTTALALTELGWTADQDSRSFVRQLEAEQADRQAWDELLSGQGHQLDQLDCVITDWQTLQAGTQLKLDGSSLGGCLNTTTHNKSEDKTTSLIYVVQAEAMPSKLGSQPHDLLSVDSAESHQPWISRQLRYDGTTPISRTNLYLSNQCQEGWCEPQAFVQTGQSDVDLKLSLKGVYHRPTKPSPLSTAQTVSHITNGGFEQGGTGWSWKEQPNRFAKQCFELPFGPTRVINPDVRFNASTRNAYGFAGGQVASLNSFEKVFTSSIEQAMTQVPANAELNFRLGLQYGARLGGVYPTYMRLVAQDLNANSHDVLMTQSTQQGSFGLTPFTVDLSQYQGRHIVLRFEVCSSVNSTSVDVATRGSLLLDDVSLDIQTPPSPIGNLTQDGPCTVGTDGTCTTNLQWNAENHQTACLWEVDGQVKLLSCSIADQGTLAYHDTTVDVVHVVLKNHQQTPPDSLAGYMDGTFLDAEMLRADPAPSTTGTLSSNAPCTIPQGASKCTTQLQVSTQNAPINCLWTSQPRVRLVSCSTAASRQFNWPHTVTTGHQFELRSHSTLPSENNTDRLNGALLDTEFVYAVQAPTPDYYDNVALRGYTDNSPGDAEPLYAGAPDQLHNFHVAGDEDWTIFAMGPGQGVRVRTFADGNTAAKMVAYRVDGPYQQIAPNRWNISLSDLTFLSSDTSSGNNQLDIINNTGDLQVYVIKSFGSSAGNDTAYRISSSGL